MAAKIKLSGERDGLCYLICLTIYYMHKSWLYDWKFGKIGKFWEFSAFLLSTEDLQLISSIAEDIGLILTLL